MVTIRKFAATLFLFLCFSLLSVAPVRAAEEWTGACVGTGFAEGVPTIAGFECIFENFLTTILMVLGLAAFVMIIYAGFLYLTAGEDAKKAEAAKSTLTLAISGLAAAFVGWFILVIISYATGNPNLLQFNLSDTIENTQTTNN